MNIKILKILWAIIVVFTCNPTLAFDVKFYNINEMFGISIRETASVCSDDKGFIWTSSKTGILRLTEDNYRIYQLPFQTNDIISVRLVNKNHVLLAYTNNGQVFRYNTIYDRFDLLLDLRKPLNTIHLFVNNVLIENQETFWFASNKGLYRYQANELNSVYENEVSQTTWYDDKHLLFTDGKGLWLMDVGTLKYDNIYEYQSKSSISVQKLFYDSSADKLWIGTISDGLFRYDFYTGAFSRVVIPSLPEQPITAIEANSDSTILVGFDGKGIWEIGKNTESVLNVYKENSDDPSSLRGNGVYDVFYDRNHRIWVCTNSGGLSFFDRAASPVFQITHHINNPNSLNNNNVNKIIEDSRGNIWFATNDGVCRWNQSNNQWKTFYQGAFLSLCEDADGRIWAGSYSSGLYVLDGKTGEETAHYSKRKSDILTDSYFDIIKDHRGDLWFGSNYGEIIRYNTKKNTFHNYPIHSVFSLTELSPDKIVLASTVGLEILDAKIAETSRLLSGYLIEDLQVLNGNVWLCCSGNGLIYYDMKNQTTEIFTTESGLPSNYVSSIVYANGYLWVGTKNGLCRFDPKNKTVQNYFSIFPLSHVSYNMNAHCQLKNGQLIWGTSNGAVLFNPSEILQLEPSGKIFFQELFISGYSVRDSAAFQLTTPLDSLKDLKLKYNQNSLTLEMIPINATANVKFSWKMDGLDKEWSRRSTLRMLSYANMPSGNFTLKIKLYDSSLSYLLDEREILIHIVPPFWQTWWFLLTAIILFSGLVYFFLRDYLIRLKQRHTEDKVRFFTRTAHEVRTSLTLIQAPIAELNKMQNKTEKEFHYLKLAAEQTQRLSNVATQLLDFQKADIGKEQISFVRTDVVKLISLRVVMFDSFAKSKGVELLFTSNQPVYITAVDESMVGKIAENLISNAIKYSHPNSQVHITLACRQKEWALEVKDNGIGISKKAQRKLFREFYRCESAINNKIIGSGIGLMMVKNYVVMHGGQISCESCENAGSTFRVTIPFKEIKEQAASIIPINEKPAVVPVTEVTPQLQKIDYTQQKDMHILFVEDNDDLRNFIQYPLSEEFKVSTAEDGVLAWNFIYKNMPDLVVSDVMMPNMDGFELCRKIKSTFETSHIPVILLTALSEKAEELHGLGLGADDYLTKPFDMSILQQRIRTIIRNRKIIREKTLRLMKANLDDEPLLANEMNDKFVKKAIEVVNAHIANPLFGKNEFATAMNISESLLYKKIKAFTDQSPMDFIKLTRLNRAMEMIQENKNTITGISELCGFASVSYFSKVFKQHFGKSPSDFSYIP